MPARPAALALKSTLDSETPRSDNESTYSTSSTSSTSTSSNDSAPPTPRTSTTTISSTSTSSSDYTAGLSDLLSQYGFASPTTSDLPALSVPISSSPRLPPRPAVKTYTRRSTKDGQYHRRSVSVYEESTRVIGWDEEGPRMFRRRADHKLRLERMDSLDELMEVVWKA